MYSRAHRDLYCKFCAIFASNQNTLTTTNNREKPGKLVTGPLWGFIRLTDKDGYFYEPDKLGYHKASIIKVRRDIYNIFLATLDFVDNETNSILLVFIEDAVQINFNLLNDLV